ncbi:MAG: EAL domain-containing protein, partial [bacterium]|nr:EAL domain-containing protein [bacterium]
GVVQIANSLGIEVVAEGVENDAQLEILKNLGCAVFQGFLLGRPQPLEDLEARLGE